MIYYIDFNYYLKEITESPNISKDLTTAFSLCFVYTNLNYNILHFTMLVAEMFLNLISYYIPALGCIHLSFYHSIYDFLVIYQKKEYALCYLNHSF